MFLEIAAEKCSLRLLDSHWAMIKGMGKPLKNAKRLLDSLWAILDWYWKTTWKWPNKTYTNEEIVLLAGWNEKSSKWPHQQLGDKAELPSAYWQTHANFHPSSLKQSFSVYMSKNRRLGEKFLKPSAAPLLIIFHHITPLLARQTGATDAAKTKVVNSTKFAFPFPNSPCVDYFWLSVEV